MVKHQTIIEFEGDITSIELVGSFKKNMKLGISSVSKELKNCEKGYIEDLSRGKPLKDSDVIICFKSMENIDAMINILSRIKKGYLENR